MKDVQIDILLNDNENDSLPISPRHFYNQDEDVSILKKSRDNYSTIIIDDKSDDTSQESQLVFDAEIKSSSSQAYS